MIHTDKLKLNLPEYTDIVDIEQLNDKFRILDQTVSEVAEKRERSNCVGLFLTRTQSR